jgi:2-C-methyl-D-erythritol 4-phosphate cytidylyltransferase
MSQSQIAAIIPAAGSGERLGVGIPKALVEVSGQTLIERAVHNISRVASLVVVAAPTGFEEVFRKLLSSSSVVVVSGGQVRSQSVANALTAIPAEFKYVLVHDAARAFAPLAVAERVINQLSAGEDAVIPAINVVDTIKVVDKSDYVLDTPDRKILRAIQTPQGFTLNALKQAHASGKDATDDAALVADIGIRVKVVEGSSLARKITTLDDLTWARELVGQS